MFSLALTTCPLSLLTLTTERLTSGVQRISIWVAAPSTRDFSGPRKRPEAQPLWMSTFHSSSVGGQPVLPWPKSVAGLQGFCIGMCGSRTKQPSQSSRAKVSPRRRANKEYHNRSKRQAATTTLSKAAASRVRRGANVPIPTGWI